MGRFVVQRLISAVGVLLAISVLVFGLIDFLPGNAAIAMLGSEASQEEIAQVKRSLGLDRPLYERYVIWLGRVVQGDLGRSMTTQQPVRVLLLDRFGPTLLLTAAGMVVALAVGMTSGILAATHPRTAIDRLTMLVALFGNSTPVFWLGLMLVLLFAQQLRWLPTSGMQTPGQGGAVDLLLHLLLPAITIGLVSAAGITRIVRSSMLDVLRQEYVVVARAKGLRERTVTMRHALSNALLPVVTVMGLQVGHLLGGAVVTETVFAWPGIGSQMYTAINNRDVPLVIGGILLTAVMFVFINLVVDVLYVYIDPRIKYG